MDEREAVDRILKEDPPCGGGWDLRDEFLEKWHCQDCGAKRPQECKYLTLGNDGGFFRLWRNGPGISWTCGRQYFSERNGYRLPFARAFGYRFFWLRRG